RAEDFHPAGLFTGRAARPAADLALHVHLGRRLREREVGGPEPHLGGGREDAPRKRGERRLEIDERDPFVYGEPLDLLEHGRVRRVERIAAVAASRNDDPNWWWMALERA